MYPDLRSNSSDRDSVDITVALIARTSEAEATNGLSNVNAASVPSYPVISPLPVFHARAQMIAAQSIGNSILQLRTFLRASKPVITAICLRL